MISPSARFASAAIPIGLATVFIPDHSPRALAIFLVAHSALGLALFALLRDFRNFALRLFGFLSGIVLGLGALWAVILDSRAANMASIAALLWSLTWIIHWLLNGRTTAAQFLPHRDTVIQILAAAMLAIALALSFGDPVASTGFVGIYLVISGLHLGIVATSPKVG